MTATRDLSALLGSRICHDLISPLGAIGNGVELLAMSGTGAAPEIALIAESVENANARIRYYRIAFGIASESQAVGASEVRNVLADSYRKSRLTIAWLVDADCMRREVKLALLVLLCFETAMPWGGRVTVQRDGGRWTVQGTAERMSYRPSSGGCCRSRARRPHLGAGPLRPRPRGRGASRPAHRGHQRAGPAHRHLLERRQERRSARHAGAAVVPMVLGRRVHPPVGAVWPAVRGREGAGSTRLVRRVGEPVGMPTSPV